MVKDVPLFVLALVVFTYWTTVAALVAHKRMRHGQAAGVMPKQAFERWLWMLMVPMVLTWIALPILAVATHSSWLRLPEWATDLTPFYIVRCIAMFIAVVSYLASLLCWLKMGRNWSMAIVPNQDSQLVTEGLYRWVRHPIYAFSVLLMLTSVVILPAGPMVALAALHFVVMSLKARNEEQHLGKQFGESYARYCAATGRFWPCWFAGKVSER